MSETSSLSHVEDLEKEQLPSGSGSEQDTPDATGPEQPLGAGEHPMGASPPQEAEQTKILQDRTQLSAEDPPQVEEPESLR